MFLVNITLFAFVHIAIFAFKFIYIALNILMFNCPLICHSQSVCMQSSHTDILTIMGFQIRLFNYSDLEITWAPWM